MEAASKRRLAEAEECVKKAEHHLKTSIIKMKFKPDFDSAAIEYQRAAVCCKNAEALEKSREMYLKAAEMHLSCGNLFHAAKCREEAAMLSKDMGDMDGAKKYMELAADGYAESGSSDTSAMALNKAASFLENTDPEKAIQVYNKALTMVQQTDRIRMAEEFLNRLTRLYLKLEKYSDAIRTLDDQVDKYMDLKEPGRVCQLTTALVLVQLARGDSVAAMKSFQNSFRCEGFEHSEEARTCNALISTFESGDNKAFQEVLQRPILRTMDNEYLRLMKKLKVEDELKSSEHVGGGAEFVNQEGEEDEDEDLK